MSWIFTTYLKAFLIAVTIVRCLYVRLSFCKLFFSRNGDTSWFFLNKETRPLPRGNNHEIAKIHWRNLKSFFSRITGRISTTLGFAQSILRWKDSSVLNKGRGCQQGGDNYKIAKIHWLNLFKKYSQEQHDTKHPWVKRI